MLPSRLLMNTFLMRRAAGRTAATLTCGGPTHANLCPPIATARRRCATHGASAALVASLEDVAIPSPSASMAAPDGKVRIRFLLSKALPDDDDGDVGADTNTDGLIRDVFTYPDVSLKDVAESAGLDINAACGGTCKCSTCHMYILNGSNRTVTANSSSSSPSSSLASLLLCPAPIVDVPAADDEELDMLDLAIGRDTPLMGAEEMLLSSAPSADASASGGLLSALVVEGSSRLGCQVMVTDEMDGLVVRVATGQLDRRYSR